MAKRSRRTVAASAAAAAGGALAAGKVVHDLVADRNERKRSRRFRLEPDETPHQGIDRVARGQLGLAISLIEGHEGDGPGAIHDARKALKRERAVLRLCREWLGDERFRQENTILRDAGRSLSGARDAQVLIETLDGLPGTWSRFREELVAEARAFEEHDDEHDSRSNVVIALAGVRERVELWPLPDEGGPEGLASGLKRIYRKARDAGLEAAKHPNSENLHELRKRSKDVWYAAQLLGPISPKRVRKLRRRAHRLTDVLGQDHDLAVLLERAEATPASFGGGELKQLRALIARRRRGLRREALERAAKLYRRKPRKLLRRLGVASR
jgi:CHAD domain-containing protein